LKREPFKVKRADTTGIEAQQPARKTIDLGREGPLLE